MSTKKKLVDMNHEEAFFYILDCAKAYYDHAHSDGEEFNPRTAKGKKIIHFAHYIKELVQRSKNQGVSI